MMRMQPSAAARVGGRFQRRFLGFVVVALSVLAGKCGLAETTAPMVPRFGRHEVTLTATGSYANPYVDLTAEVTFTEPDQRGTRTAPLYWDGGATWRFRFAPDKTGSWSWTVRSADAGLDGRHGSFVCVESDRRGSLQPMSGAPRHFQYQNGERAWFMGDTAWAYVSDSAAENHDRAAAERYLRARAGQGFNVIHLMLLNEAGWANSGGPPWLDLAAEKLNPAYFREAEDRIAFANARGVVTGLALAWGNKGRSEPWSWGKFSGVEARLRYARYVAARFAAFDVYFLVAGEWHGEVRSRSAAAADVRREFVALGDALRAADPHRRMIGIHPMTEHGSTREFNDVARWMDFADYQQNYQELHARLLASRAVAKPLVNSEYGYFLRDQNGDGVVDKPHSSTVDDMRHATWDIAMAGAYFVSGFGSTYMGGNRHPTPFLPDDPKNVAWTEQIAHVKSLFSSLEYWRLEPHDEFVSSPEPRGGDRASRIEVAGRQVPRTQAPATTYWCLAEPGRTYVIYLRGLSSPVATRVAANREAWATEQFDPRTGERTVLILKPSDEGQLVYQPPDTRDWVLLIRAKE